MKSYIDSFHAFSAPYLNGYIIIWMKLVNWFTMTISTLQFMHRISVIDPKVLFLLPHAFNLHIIILWPTSFCSSGGVLCSLVWALQKIGSNLG